MSENHGGKTYAVFFNFRTGKPHDGNSEQSDGNSDEPMLLGRTSG